MKVPLCNIKKNNCPFLWKSTLKNLIYYQVILVEVRRLQDQCIMSVGDLIQISITMIKFCSSSICQPLLLLFAKKEIHKSSKTTVQFLYNLSVISVLRNHYSTRYSSPRGKPSYSTYQFGFKPGNSFTILLIEAMRLEVLPLISRKLSTRFGTMPCLNWKKKTFLAIYMFYQKQRVMLNGQVSSWAKLQQKLPKVRTIVFFLTLMIYKKIYP